MDWAMFVVFEALLIGAVARHFAAIAAWEVAKREWIKRERRKRCTKNK